MRNAGVITNLPSDCVIESPGVVDRFGINMIANVTLPDACAATCLASVNVQRMSVKAAMTGDVELLKLAVLHDPLVGAICTPDEVWQMVDEMLVAQAAWLPQYADAIPSARERLRNPKVKTRDWTGAARRSVRSVEELRAAKQGADGAPSGWKEPWDGCNRVMPPPFGFANGIRVARSAVRPSRRNRGLLAGTDIQ